MLWGIIWDKKQEEMNERILQLIQVKAMEESRFKMKNQDLKTLNTQEKEVFWYIDGYYVVCE